MTDEEILQRLVDEAQELGLYDFTEEEMGQILKDFKYLKVEIGEEDDNDKEHR